jgi:putative NADH-flavin reductase
MRLALFGATGRAGGAILHQAHTAGYEVSALARSPGKLDGDGLSAAVTAGDVRDLAAAERVVEGADAVVSAIGGTRPGNLAVLQQGTAAILTAMSRHDVRRLIVIQGFHLPFPADPHNLGRPVMRAVLRVWNRHLSADSYRMAAVLTESDLDWTLIRMPRLTPGLPSADYRVGKLALGPWSTVTTGQVAHFTLSCLAADGFMRQAPMIADAGRAGHKDPAGTSARGRAVAGEPPELAGGPAGRAGQDRP